MPGLTREQRVAGVGALLSPTNIAIVGASDRPGSWSGGVRRALERSGFAGRVYPVNPRNKTVWEGETCYPSLRDLPERPDHVVVLVPGAAAATTITEAGQSGARSATVFSSGFGEGGDPEGRALAETLRGAIAALAPLSGPISNAIWRPGASYSGRRIRTVARAGRDRGPERRHRRGAYRALASRHRDQLCADQRRARALPRTIFRYLVDDPDTDHRLLHPGGHADGPVRARVPASRSWW